MQVEAVMKRDVVKIFKDKSLRQAAEKMNEERIGSLIVWEGSKDNFSGILTERDILEAVAAERVEGTQVKEVMQRRDDVIAVDPGASLETAADKMVANSIKHLPVVGDEDQILGIVTATDLISYEDQLVDKLSQVFLSSGKKAEGGFAS